MKKIILTLSAVLLVLLAVSCNMDSTTGLFQEAGTSVKKESYVIRKVIAADEDNGIYLVAADEGIFLYNAKSKAKIGETVADGRTSRNVIGGYFTESGSTSKWKCIYFDETQNGGDGKYHCIDQNGTVTASSDIESSKYIPVSSTYDNGYTVIVFRNSDSTKNYVCITALKYDTQDFTTITDTGCTNVSYIGDEYFIGIETSTSNNVYFEYSTTGTLGTLNVNANNYITHEGTTFLSRTDVFYKAAGSSIDSVSSNNTYTRTTAVTDTNSNSYYFLSGLNYVYKITAEGKMEAKSCSSLSSVEVVYIAKVDADGSYINVLTAESGAKCINITDGKIDSSWK